VAATLLYSIIGMIYMWQHVHWGAGIAAAPICGSEWFVVVDLLY
jgi:hypothetical protein